MSLKETLKIFSSRNVCYLYAGDFSLFLGFWLTFLSIIWLVYQLTHSSFSLGVMGLVLNFPVFFLLPFAGVLADRFNKCRILVWCSAGFMFTPMVLAWAAWQGKVSIKLLIAVAPIYGAIYAILNPAVNAFIKEVVDQQQDVHRVTGLISSITKIAQLLAAALNGLLHLFSGVAAVLTVAVVSHMLSLISFLRIQKKDHSINKNPAHPLRQFWEGVRYTFSFSPFLSVLMMAATGSLVVLAWQWQLPVFANDLIGGGSKTLSLLFLFGGIGGITGGVYVSIRRSSKGLMKLATIALIMIGGGLLLFAFSTSRVGSFCLSFLIDAGWVILLASTSATLQLIVDADKRGRIMSFYAMGVFGFMPVTNFLIGSLCAWLGVSWGIFLVALFCILIACFYWGGMAAYREQLLSLYTEKVILEWEQPI